MESCCGALVVAGGCFGWLRLRGRPRKSPEPLPATMRRLVLREANVDVSKAKIEVEEVEVPQPKSGQVLIKVAASPVNPSDDGTWKVPPSQGYPLPLGTEGSGTVVATGGGVLAAGWMGCKVIFLGKAFAQYAIADAVMLTEVPKDVSVEDACAGYINPLTAISIVEVVRVHKSNVFILTAAASQLGQMLVRYCQSEGAEGATVVSLVRRKEQVAILERLGAKHIIDTSEDGWESKLQSLIQELKIFHAFDCISGDMPGKLLSLLPPGGTCWVYGRLSGKLEGIDPVDFIYRNKKLKGFLVTTWLFGAGFLQGLRRWRWQTKLMRENLKTTFTSEFQDTSMREMLNVYCAHKASGATGRKIRVRPEAA